MSISFLLMKSCQLCVVLRTKEVTRKDLFLTLGMFLWQPTTRCRSWKQWYGSLFQELLHALLRTCLSKKKIIIHSIAYSIPYDVCHGLGNTAANHNGLEGALFRNLQLSLGSRAKIFCSDFSEKCTVAAFFTLKKKAPWRTRNTWPTLGISAEYHVIRPDLCRKADVYTWRIPHTPPCCKALLHVTGFHPSSTRKEQSILKYCASYQKAYCKEQVAFFKSLTWWVKLFGNLVSTVQNVLFFASDRDNGF